MAEIPRDITAERAVISSMLYYPETIPYITEVVPTADCFFDLFYKQAFAAIVGMYDSGAGVDPVTVIDSITSPGQDRVETLDRLTILRHEADPLNYRDHATIVADRADRRRALEVAGQIISSVSDTESAERLIQQAALKMNAKKGKTIEQIVDELEQSTEQQYIPSQYPDLDMIISGFGKGHLIILAARPGIGKTSFAINIAAKTAGQGCHTAFFSLEMPAGELMYRIMAYESGSSYSSLRSGNRSDQGYAFTRARNNMGGLPLMIFDDCYTLSEVRSSAFRTLRGKDHGMIIVDYLQLMTNEAKAESRQVEVASMSRSLKMLAKQLNVPVIALSQLNREIENRRNKRPQLSDLRESGAIEQDADIVMFIDRSMNEEDYRNKSRPNEGEAVLYVEKNRHGRTGKVYLYFDSKSCEFNSLERRYP